MEEREDLQKIIKITVKKYELLENKYGYMNVKCIKQKKILAGLY